MKWSVGVLSRAVRRLPLIVLLVALATGFGFHAYRAEHPTASYQSADERSYGKLAVSIATDQRYGADGMRDPLHWPPGAPLLFAAGHALFGSEASERSYDIPAAYWLQAVMALGTALAAAGFAWVLAGAWPGAVAGALVALYPPLILATGEQLSEPLGAFLFTAGLFALALAAKRRAALLYLAGGALLGLAVLARADLLLVPPLIAGILLLWLWRGQGDRRGGLRAALLVAGGALLVMAPWMVYASSRADEFVPVTRGSASAFFVGTYLPGDGHTVGMKRALGEQARRRNPKLRGIPDFELEAQSVLAVVADRHPELPTNEAVALEARKNLVRYGLKDPVDFGLMMLDKGVQRMWSRYARGGARPTSPWIRGWHIALVLAGFAGLLLGILRRRSVPLAFVLVPALYATALHSILVSQARYNLPLMPAVIAGGVAGWALWLHARSGSASILHEKPAPSVEERLHAPA